MSSERDNKLDIIEAYAVKLLEHCHYTRVNGFDLNTLATLKALLGDACIILKDVEEDLE